MPPSCLQIAIALVIMAAGAVLVASGAVVLGLILGVAALFVAGWGDGTGGPQTPV